MAAGQVAQGTTLGINAGGTTTTYTTIAEVTSISGPNQERDEIETTHLTSADNTKEFQPGNTDPGEVELEFNFLPSNATHDQLRDEMYSTTVKGFKITWPDAATTTCTFQGFAKSNEIEGETGDKLSGSASVKVTGKPVFA